MKTHLFNYGSLLRLIPVYYSDDSNLSGSYRYLIFFLARRVRNIHFHLFGRSCFIFFYYFLPFRVLIFPRYKIICDRRAPILRYAYYIPNLLGLKCRINNKELYYITPSPYFDTICDCNLKHFITYSEGNRNYTSNVYFALLCYFSDTFGKLFNDCLSYSGYTVNTKYLVFSKLWSHIKIYRYDNKH